jgi:hypothetical protein
VVNPACAFAAVLLTVACAGATTQELPFPPRLSRVQAEQVMLRADDLRRAALESPGSVSLSDAFGGPALSRLTAQSQTLRLRQARMEERTSSRELVFWDPLAREAVLQVAAERRIVTADDPHAGWSSTVLQWWARLQRVGDSWVVVDDQELPPDRWRPAPIIG